MYILQYACVSLGNSVLRFTFQLWLFSYLFWLEEVYANQGEVLFPLLDTSISLPMIGSHVHPTLPLCLSLLSV